MPGPEKSIHILHLLLAFKESETLWGKPCNKVGTNTGNDVSHLIGRHGESLYAINYIASILVNKGKDDFKRVCIDVEDYRKHREENLIAMANRAASRVAKYKRPVSLDPMPAYERRIIHSALQSNRNVVTESQGVEPNRCVIVKTRPYVKKF